MLMKRLKLILAMLASLMFFSCNGILENIYDLPGTSENDKYGFILGDGSQGRIYIDATGYQEWHYVDLKNKVVITTSVDEPAPDSWDFAIHRYDAKTNGGAVAELQTYDFASMPDIQTIPDSSFVEDIWTTDQITIDMSQMMNGIIIYAEDYYNPCLSRWLNVDTSMMPPIYTLSEKVYLIRLSDGTYAALRLSNFMNDAAVKGFMSIDYLYPAKS